MSVLTGCIVTSSTLRPRTCLILYLYGLFVKVETEKFKGLGLNLIRNNYKIKLERKYSVTIYVQEINGSTTEEMLTLIQI